MECRNVTHRGALQGSGETTLVMIQSFSKKSTWMGVLSEQVGFPQHSVSPDQLCDMVNCAAGLRVGK